MVQIATTSTESSKNRTDLVRVKGQSKEDGRSWLELVHRSWCLDNLLDIYSPTIWCLASNRLIVVTHSTETALLRVISDILGAVDRGSVTLLGLLDLSAAFDTVDHTILLDRLRIRFGVGGGVLEWIRTFLVDRTQQVLYMGRLSSIGRLDFGVPQGSVSRPSPFSCCTLPSCSKSSTERDW